MSPLLASTALGLVAAWPVGVLGLGLGRLVERLTDDPRPRAAAWGVAHALPALALAATVALTFAPRPPAEPAPTALQAAAETPVVAAATPGWTPETELTENLAWSLVGLSVAGLLARGWRWSRGRRRLAALRAQAEPCRDADLIEAVRQRAARLGVKAPSVRISAEITAPLLAGARRPTILLPKTLAEGADARRLALICGHELAHLRRRDNWRIPAEEAMAGLFWLSPPVGALRGRMLAAREAVCDLAALDGAAPEARRDYARALVEALRMGAQPSPAFHSAFTGRDQGLVSLRLAAILRPDSARASVGRVGLAIVLGGVLTAAAGAGSLALADQARRLAPPQSAPAEIAAPARQASDMAQDAMSAEPAQAMTESAAPVAEVAPMRALAAPAADPAAPATSAAPPMVAVASPSPSPEPRPAANPQPAPNAQPSFDARMLVQPSVDLRADIQTDVRVTVPATASEDLSRRIKVMDPTASTRTATASRVGVGVTVTNQRADPWSH